MDLKTLLAQTRPATGLQQAVNGGGKVRPEPLLAAAPVPTATPTAAPQVAPALPSSPLLAKHTTSGGFLAAIAASRPNQGGVTHALAVATTTQPESSVQSESAQPPTIPTVEEVAGLSVSLQAPTQPKIIGAAEYNHPSQPEAMTEEAAKDFKATLQMVHDNLDNRELVGQAMTAVLAKLKARPEFKAMLAPEDMGIMIRALRINYGVLLQYKQDKASKKKKSGAEVDNIAGMLGDMKFDL